ncbi:ferric reductase-like transmembrane domain-containing protein [Embleya sp. NPDC008237]|uniref:ferredoxin reductase family protein n=1 Tax=Embleya sp. NPDC008237 TaxID=3363978 RepID=UPI0036DFC526
MPVGEGQRTGVGAHRTVAPPRISPHVLLFALLFVGGTTFGVWTSQIRPSTRLATLLATAAHLTGLLAGLGMLAMLLLMTRVPAVEHGIGADTLARWHARGGRTVILLTLAHAGLAWWAHSAYHHMGPVDGLLDVLGYPALAAATFGCALLVAVAVFSARAVRTRVRHETWLRVHLLTYVGTAIAFFHQPAGPDLAGAPVLAWLWTFLHVQVAVLLLWYRVVVPLCALRRHDIRVVQVYDETPDVVSVLMTGRGLASLDAASGQFFRWRFLTRRLWWTSLPFSVSAPVRDDTLRITVKVVGDHTRRVKRLRPGTRVLATGPFGAMTARRRTRRKVLLIAGGIGITPMRALFETLPGEPGDITLLYRANNSTQLALREELEEIAWRRSCRVHYLLGSSRGPDSPFTSAGLRRLVPDIGEHDVYLCGSPDMARATLRILRRAGVPRGQVHAEVFDA